MTGEVIPLTGGGQQVRADKPDDVVALLHEVAEGLDTAMLGYSPAAWQDALNLLRDLRSVTDLLSKIDATLVRYLYLHGEHGKRVVDGVGEVWIGRGRAKERWEGPDAIAAYVDRKITDIGGEVPDPAQVIEWVLEVLPASPSTSLRVTPLRSVGIEVEDFRTSEPGSLRVTFD